MHGHGPMSGAAVSSAGQAVIQRKLGTTGTFPSGSVESQILKRAATAHPQHREAGAMVATPKRFVS
jgi:hypothetical protein